MLEVPSSFGYRPSEGPGQPAQSQLRASRGEVAQLLPPGYRARVSGGSRNLPYVPWLAVLDEDVTTTAREGFYPLPYSPGDVWGVGVEGRKTEPPASLLLPRSHESGTLGEPQELRGGG
jgi:hypothetical protein